VHSLRVDDSDDDEDDVVMRCNNDGTEMW
jgi:hypothetical protein